MIGRIQICAVVGCDLQMLVRPAFAFGQLILFQTRKERRHLIAGLLVIQIFDLRLDHRRVRDQFGIQSDGYVYESARHVTPSCFGFGC